MLTVFPSVYSIVMLTSKSNSYLCLGLPSFVVSVPHIEMLASADDFCPFVHLVHLASFDTIYRHLI